LTTNKQVSNKAKTKWIFKSPTRCQRQSIKAFLRRKNKKQKLNLTLTLLPLRQKKILLLYFYSFFHLDAPLFPSKEEDAPKVAGEEEPA
jgi:hypothetical protein